MEQCGLNIEFDAPKEAFHGYQNAGGGT